MKDHTLLSLPANSDTLVIELVVFAELFGNLIRAYLLLLDRPEWLPIDKFIWNGDLGLHQVLRVLVPHCLMPLSLN